MRSNRSTRSPKVTYAKHDQINNLDHFDHTGQIDEEVKPKRKKRSYRFLTSLALATALALGGLPALASANTDDADDSGSDTSTSTGGTLEAEPWVGPPGDFWSTGDGTTGEAITEIQGYATDNYEPPISVKIPMGLYLAFNTAGYSDITVAKPSEYKLINDGGVAVKLTDIQVTEVKDEFNINAMYRDGDKFFFDEKPVEKNIITLHYDDGTNNTYLSPDHSLKQAVRNDKFLNYEFKEFSDSIVAAGTDMPIDFRRSYCYFPHAITASDPKGAYGELCKLVYYIEEA